MSEYLIALIVILLFLAVIYVVWRGGKLRVKYKDIGVDAEGAKQSEPADQPPQVEEKAGPSMSMEASGAGSSISGSRQTASGVTGGSPDMKMNAKNGGKIKDAEQRVSGTEPEQ